MPQLAVVRTLLAIPPLLWFLISFFSPRSVVNPLASPVCLKSTSSTVYSPATLVL